MPSQSSRPRFQPGRVLACLWLLLLPPLLLLLTACATPRAGVVEPHPPGVKGSERSEGAEAAGEFWWYARFRHVWPVGAEPAWHRDVLLADRVVGPILAEHGGAITLWRVHRRAGRDGAGHQFSFIFRATPEAAARINARIAADPLLKELLRTGIIETVRLDDPAKPQRPALADTSDPAWTPEIQRAWPHFIMGVSQFWLELIRELAANTDESPDLDSRYAAISAELDTIWLHQGSHALLHHLNAVFGYRELNVLRRERMRF